MTPLKLEIPKRFPHDNPASIIKSPNLETRKGPRPPFLVPDGVRNLAFKRAISGSDEDPIIGDLDLIADGDKEGGEGSFVEFGPGVQHVQIDLGAVHEIWAVLFWHYHQKARIYNDVVVRSSDDPDFITNVRTLFNNDHDNSAGLGIGKDKAYIETNEGKLVAGKSVRTRYIRLYSNGNVETDLNHYIEVEIYGLKDSTKKTEPETMRNSEKRYSPGKDATIVAPDFSPGYDAAPHADPDRGQTI